MLLGKSMLVGLLTCVLVTGMHLAFEYSLSYTLVTCKLFCVYVRLLFFFPNLRKLWLPIITKLSLFQACKVGLKFLNVLLPFTRLAEWRRQTPGDHFNRCRKKHLINIIVLNKAFDKLYLLTRTFGPSLRNTLL